MTPTLCILGGCNGAGKTTLARKLLPRLGLMRFLNADEIARGLSPLDPSLTAFKAGRLLIEEARGLIKAKASFAIESTLSGKTYVAMIREAKAQGYRFLLHYIMIGSGDQAVGRVALRVKIGGHHVPEGDVRRRFERSRKHFIGDYLPLADEWVVWDNASPPHRQIADSSTHTLEHACFHPTSGGFADGHVRDGAHWPRSRPDGDGGNARLLQADGDQGNAADDAGAGEAEAGAEEVEGIKLAEAFMTE
jgi:predicted ABC-type ATPase